MKLLSTAYDIYQQARNIEFNTITMADGCYNNLDSLLDKVAKTETDSWLLIDKLHLAPDGVLKIIRRRLQTVVRTKGRILNYSYCSVGGVGRWSGGLVVW